MKNKYIILKLINLSIFYKRNNLFLIKRRIRGEKYIGISSKILKFLELSFEEKEKKYKVQKCQSENSCESPTKS